MSIFSMELFPLIWNEEGSKSSCGAALQVPTPLTKLYALRRLKLVDARFIHKEHGIAYWSKDKCITMNNMSAWQKALRRRGANVKFLLDGGQ